MRWSRAQLCLDSGGGIGSGSERVSVVIKIVATSIPVVFAGVVICFLKRDKL